MVELWRGRFGGRNGWLRNRKGGGLLARPDEMDISLLDVAKFCACVVSHVVMSFSLEPEECPDCICPPNSKSRRVASLVSACELTECESFEIEFGG